MIKIWIIFGRVAFENSILKITVWSILTDVEFTERIAVERYRGPVFAVHCTPASGWIVVLPDNRRMESTRLHPLCVLSSLSTLLYQLISCSLFANYLYIVTLYNKHICPSHNYLIHKSRFIYIHSYMLHVNHHFYLDINVKIIFIFISSTLLYDYLIIYFPYYKLITSILLLSVRI